MRYVLPPPIANLPTLAQIEASLQPAIQARIAPYVQQILGAYVTYEAARADTLHQLQTINIPPDAKEAMELIFSRRLGRFKELLQGLTDHFATTGESTCPYCNFGEQVEHDHFLPKRPFGEFALYPNNLVPICKQCNNKKLNAYQRNGDRLFKHLFTELQGVVGLLEAHVAYMPRPTVSYRLVNPGTLTVAQFGVLGRHFARLDLARRYAKNASTVLARLIRQFRTPASLGMGQARMRQRLEQMAEDRALVSPPNHWEVALMDTLAATDDFTEHVFN